MIQNITAQEKKPASPASFPGDYKQAVEPLLKKYCYDCHAGKDPEGKLILDKLNPDGGRAVRSSWQKVRDNLHSTLMPPDDSPQPTSEERAQLIAWLDFQPLHIDCSSGAFPGRVTVRRLNRVEYNLTIRDLCGVKIQPADDFPSDDVGYGFDSIGDVLSLPPLLLEKYLQAADRVAQEAIVVFDSSSVPVKKKEGATLGSNGDVALEHEFPREGVYLLRATASADQAGTEKARIAFSFDQKELQQFEIPLHGRANEREFELKLTIEKGKHRFAVAFLNDYYNPKDPDPELRGDRNVYVGHLEIVGPLGVPPEKLPDSHQQILFVLSEENQSPEERAAKIFKRFASRAYRRPATEEDVKRLVALFRLTQENGDSFERGIQVGVQAVLTSPHFLFRIEQEPGPSDKNGVRTLNEYELATRLSYFLWSSMPDGELFALAHQGKLRENLDAQIRRMLKDEKARSLVKNFAGQWLQLRSLERVSPNRQKFPEWSSDLQQDMERETERFFEHIMREDRNVVEFLTADYSFLNERLAKHYGIPNVKGNEFRQVSLPAEQRGGLLGQASILTVTSNPGRTSPVKRGKWILENLLAAPPPPAPPNVPALEEARRGMEKASLRQRLEAHRANPSCNACHKILDPLGFALENYDAIGAWRTKDGKFDIDPTGELPTGEKISGAKDLRAILGTREADFRRCFAEKLLTYALGRGLEIDDACTLTAITNEASTQQNKFSAFILAIVHSEPFQKRSATRVPVK